MSKSPEGSVHGRFQPLHNGHLEYILAAKERCEFLWIGITQFDVRALASSPVDKHRDDPGNNPLTYFERVELITEAMHDEGLTREQFGVVPFPIEHPNLLHDFLSTRIPVFTTIYDDWNRHKVKVLQNSGYDVVVLYERTVKVYQGTHVRNKIREGNDSWQNMVPAATIRAVAKYDVRNRLLASRS